MGFRFSKEEDELLERLRIIHRGSTGAPRKCDNHGGLGTIAKIMNRPKSSIQMRLKYLAEKAEGK